MTEQLDLFTDRPRVAPEDIDHVCRCLVGRGWVPLEELIALTGFDKRKIRDCAQHSEARILSAPGIAGYHLFDSSVELGEAQRCSAAHRSQSDKQRARAMQIDRRAHQLIHRASFSAGSPRSPSAGVSAPSAASCENSNA